MKQIGVVIVLIILVIAFVALIAIDVTLYKKYKDIIDYFNQDSQLLSERFGNIEDRVTSVKTSTEGVTAQLANLDTRIKTLEDIVKGMADFQGKLKNELTTKIGLINNDMLDVKAKLSADEKALQETIKKLETVSAQPAGQNAVTEEEPH